MTLCVCVCVCVWERTSPKPSLLHALFIYLPFWRRFPTLVYLLGPRIKAQSKRYIPESSEKHMCADSVAIHVHLWGSLQVMFYISGMCCFDPSMDRGELWPMAEALGQGFWPSYSALPQPRVIVLCHSSGPWPLGYTPLGHGSWPRPMAMALVHDPCHP